ncbi:hypothetical protein L6452_34617 [Arctium lappa]|uniref:Uncharacterized protein n=1 Tax=Arctium lappa TaxID=4217 RepID=A0ACB8YMX9_ARCLA|nr:hypothetical protein L6452_34617 [Arctium lappa]
MSYHPNGDFYEQSSGQPASYKKQSSGHPHSSGQLHTSPPFSLALFLTTNNPAPALASFSFYNLSFYDLWSIPIVLLLSCFLAPCYTIVEPSRVSECSSS